MRQKEPIQIRHTKRFIKISKKNKNKKATEYSELITC